MKSPCLASPFLAFVALICLPWTISLAQQQEASWPSWRGPEHTGVAPSGTPPTEWSEDSATWKVDLPGRGNATPIVWGNRIFIATAIETDRAADAASDEPAAEEPPQGPGGRRGGRFGRGSSKPTNYYQYVAMCLDLETGKTLWQKTAIEAVPSEAGHSDNTHASASPVTDGKHVYFFFGSQGLYCYTLDGDLVWSTDLGDMQTRAGFGEGASPALHGDTLVVNWDHEGPSFITALDANTGQPRWKKDRDERTTWVTPLIVEAAGKTQVIVNGSNRTRSYDLTNGDVIWECGGQVGNPIPSPVIFENLAICMSGYRGAAILAIPLDSTGDVTNSETIAWQSERNAPYVPSPLLYGERLYYIKSNNGILSIANARTGELLVSAQRLGDISNVYASPVGADGRVYIAGRDGTTMVLADSDEYQVLATNRLDEGIDATPVVVGGKLLIRGYDHLFCFGE
ncbi:outer membrane protein assembly factor BamB family protein [Aeoliella mucimassa]|uniref:Outer membrane biogenesis protein BamB n=1 Tax=Aeoliella mucimassa TaxID=2527972 RepID=A0A518AL17_9BACT|nr:PQQ-binding-like beta-propeller repeat protein [Aeoliella mucimassa]QDU55429.1 outer membrane biogenesis protein BamB [Aeoliella mucimassa]